MSIKPSDIWPGNSGLPPLEEIYRYIDGKMTRDEQYRFERQMEASELLAHAVEGLAMERTKNQENIDEINAFIDQKTGKEGKIVSMFSYGNLAIAASTLIFLTAGILFLLYNRDEKKSEPIAAAQSPIEPLQNSDAAPPASSQTEIAAEQPQTDDAIAYADEETSKGLASDPKPRIKLRNRKNTNTLPALASNDEKVSALAGSAPASEAEIAMEPVPDTVRYDLLAMNMMDTELKTEELEKDKLDHAFELSDFKEYNKSESKPTPAAPAKSASAGASSVKRKKADAAEDKALPGRAATVYKWDESIIVFIKSGKTNLALMELNLIIEANDHRKEPAIWIKAACLLLMNRKKEAREMLKVLSESNGIYQEKATNLLKELR